MGLNKMNKLIAYVKYHWNLGASKERTKVMKRLIEEERKTKNKLSYYKQFLTEDEQ